MLSKSLFLLLSVAALGSVKQAQGQMKLCHRVRDRGLRCLRPKSLDGKMKRGMKVKTQNHFQRRLHKVWLKFLVNKSKSKKQIKGGKKVSAMKRKNERRRGKETLASVKQRKRTGTAARRKKLGKRRKKKSQIKRKRKKHMQKKIKLSKIIHIHIYKATKHPYKATKHPYKATKHTYKATKHPKKEPSKIRLLRPKKRIKTKQRKKSLRNQEIEKSFLEK